MIVSYASVALFVYNRPVHTRKTIEALAANEGAQETDLIIFSDGPKSSDTDDQVIAVRDYLYSVQGFKSVSVVMRDKNLGLANSIVGGVTDVLKKHDRVIVMEDDLVTSPYFLRYMNEALEYYKHNDRVVSIHSYVYPVKKSLPETFFLRGADCWGWATWRRGWAHFNPDGENLLSQLRRRKLTKEFDFNGALGYTRMLKAQIAGINDSWAVRWYASAFLLNKLTLYPCRSLIQNIGLDSSGTHSGSSDSFDILLSENPIRIGGIPVEDSNVGREAFIAFLRCHHSWRDPLALLAGIFRKLTQKL